MNLFINGALGFPKMRGGGTSLSFLFLFILIIIISFNLVSFEEESIKALVIKTHVS